MRRRSPGSRACGRAGASRSRQPTSSRPGASPSASSLPNHHGTAPGWWVDRPDGRVIVLLPGPPREMRPMWAEAVLPRLVRRGVGGDSDVRTLRLTRDRRVTGGRPAGRADPAPRQPDRRDLRPSRGRGRAGSPPARRAAAQPPRSPTRPRPTVLATLGDHVWARGETDLVGGARRGARRARLVACHHGARHRGCPGHAAARAPGDAPGRGRRGRRPGTGPRGPDDDEPELLEAERVRVAAGADVGLAIRVEAAGADTSVHVGIVTPSGRHAERRLAFQGGPPGCRPRSDRRCGGPGRVPARPSSAADGGCSQRSGTRAERRGPRT